METSNLSFAIFFLLKYEKKSSGIKGLFQILPNFELLFLDLLSKLPPPK